MNHFCLVKFPSIAYILDLELPCCGQKDIKGLRIDINLILTLKRNEKKLQLKRYVYSPLLSFQK